MFSFGLEKDENGGGGACNGGGGGGCGFESINHNNNNNNLNNFSLASNFRTNLNTPSSMVRQTASYQQVRSNLEIDNDDEMIENERSQRFYTNREDADPVTPDEQPAIQLDEDMLFKSTKNQVISSSMPMLNNDVQNGCGIIINKHHQKVNGKPAKESNSLTTTTAATKPRHLTTQLSSSSAGRKKNISISQRFMSLLMSSSSSSSASSSKSLTGEKKMSIRDTGVATLCEVERTSISSPLAKGNQFFVAAANEEINQTNKLLILVEDDGGVYKGPPTITAE